MSNCNTTRDVVAWLRRPNAYPHRPAQVEVVETHISLVFLAGERVYKLKKPVKFEFLDFSTLARRAQACQDEVRLNRRLAGDVYLGVVPIVRDAVGELRLGGVGEVLDWVVEMRRLPLERTLDNLHRAGRLTAEHVDQLTRVLADFYRSLAAIRLAPAEYRRRCEEHVRGNLADLLRAANLFPDNVVQRVHGFQLQVLALEPELVEARVELGKIVDGHGDLRPEHICFGEPIAIFDCIEFNAELRQIDVLDELAFLAAECDFLGASWVGQRLLARYDQLTGDSAPPKLLAFYQAYRACVRAKVAALRAEQLVGAAREAVTADARKHLEWADRYAGPWLAPRVIVVGGLSGTGKTTLARALADALGAALLRTDVVRQETPELKGADLENRYEPAARQAVYEAMLARASQLHREGITVVLDGTFSRAALVEQARRIAGDRSDAFLAIECVCPSDVAQQRIATRRATGRDASEATPEVHRQQLEEWEVWPSTVRQLRIDTTAALHEQVATARAALVN